MNDNIAEGAPRPEDADHQDNDSFFDLDELDTELGKRTQEWAREQSGLNADGSFPNEASAGHQAEDTSHQHKHGLPHPDPSHPDTPHTDG